MKMFYERNAQTLLWKGKLIYMDTIEEHVDYDRFVLIGWCFRYGKKQFRKELYLLAEKAKSYTPPTPMDILIQEAFLTSYNSPRRASLIRKSRREKHYPKGKPYLSPLARMLGGIKELRQFRTYLREQTGRKR